jgi:tetratricopeptide (TPR) repeat protein/DNA-binding CsgD family transcriptional regulator
MTGELFLSRFTPSMMGADVLEKVFVQRGDIADRITEVVREGILTPSKHHTLVIGSRGIGKTHLLSLVHNRISRQEDLGDRVRIAWLREEEWGVASFLDFLYRILRALAARYGDDVLREQTETLFSISLKTAERRAADLLRAFIEGRSLLLIAENLDSIFSGLGKKGQQRLRAYLQEESSWTILGSSQALFSGVTLYESPFYGFFDIHHLQELTVDDAARLIHNIAELANDSELAAYVQSESGRARIRAVHHLAGGNHRVYMILSEFLTRDNLDQLVEPFLRMMDDLTPYYQARMEQLSPQQRKIIDLLCSVRGAVPVREIAKRCFISPQTASSQLKDLRERGYVDSTPIGRDAYYELSEPLMRLALEVKNQRNGHVRLFLDFLRHWYAPAELADLLARTPGEHVLEREYLQLVLREEPNASEDPQVNDLLREANALFRRGRWAAIIPYAEKLVNYRGAAADWALLGSCLGYSKRYEEAVSALDRALGMDDSNPDILLARSLAAVGLGRTGEAFAGVSKVIAMDPSNGRAYAMLGAILHEMGRNDEAVAAYDRCVELAPKLEAAWTQRSALLLRLRREEEGLASTLAGLAAVPQSAELYSIKGDVLTRLYRLDDAIAAYDAALKIKPSHANSLRGKAISLAFKLQDPEALQTAQEAYALKREDSAVTWLVGRQLVRVGDYASALPFLQKAERLGMDKALVWQHQAYALLCLGRISETMDAIDHWLSSADSAEDLNEPTLRLLGELFTQTVVETISSESARKIAVKLRSSYELYNFSAVLSSSLTKFGRVLVNPVVSLVHSRRWEHLWREVLGHHDEFKLTLRLMYTLISYREDGDPRTLLRLPMEERRIAEEMLESAVAEAEG